MTEDITFKEWLAYTFDPRTILIDFAIDGMAKFFKRKGGVQFADGIEDQLAEGIEDGVSREIRDSLGDAVEDGAQLEARETAEETAERTARESAADALGWFRNTGCRKSCDGGRKRKYRKNYS